MSTPQRIQRKRTPGWRMPEGAKYVGRPSRWGNPYRPGDDHPWYPRGHVCMTRQDAVDFYRRYFPNERLDVSELRGHDLVCWCPLDRPCHADVLLELANR